MLDPMPCPYWKVCQQLIKLHVFDLRLELGLDIGDDVLIVDSDTVWAHNVTFVDDHGKITYVEVANADKKCHGGGNQDPVNFTEAITMGPPSNIIQNDKHQATMTPYKSCTRPEYPNSTGSRHIAHREFWTDFVSFDMLMW